MATKEIAKTKNVGGRPKRFSEKNVAQIVAAIKGSRGLKTRICRALACSIDTFNETLRNFPEVKRAYDEEVYGVGDLSESTLFASIEDGDVSSAKWYLSRKCKNRGYGEDALAGGGYDVQLVADVIKGQLAVRVGARKALSDASGDDFVENADDIACED